MVLIPFTNVSKNPTCRIQLGAADANTMFDLLFSDNLFAWVHSHPHWPAKPSVEDIIHHEIPTNMIIYSVCDDEFQLYTPEEIITLNDNLVVATSPENSKTIIG
jgi:proteasome lid subunit RPN8/RPN11